MQTIAFDTESFEIGDWTILKLPLEASQQLPSRGQTMIKGTINGVQFETPLEPDGYGSHWFRVEQKLQQQAAVVAGKSAHLEVESTKEWPEPTLALDLVKALDAHSKAHELWNKITPMARWDWIRWINATKQADTRQRRIEVTCSKLSKGMRRPCCFNRNICTVPDVSKNGALLQPSGAD